jgi:hypothetical protein
MWILVQIYGRPSYSPVLQVGRHSIAGLHLDLLKLVHSAALGVCGREEAHLGDLVALGPYLDGRRDDLRPGEARVEDKLAEGLGVAIRRDADAAKSGNYLDSARSSLHAFQLFSRIRFPVVVGHSRA